MKHLQHKKEVLTPLTSAANKTLPWAICIFIVIATLVVYWQVQNHEFLNYDDTEYVTGNLVVKTGLTGAGIFWIFTESYAANWHPVTFLSHMLDVELYGLNPSGHHLTSLFFHIANSLLLFGVLLKMTGAPWQSGLVATLFALHPLNVESVAWIAERKNVLSTFFWFLTLWAYVGYVEKKKIGNYLLVVLFLSLGLMAKPMLVTLPFTLLLLDFWPLKRCGEVRAPTVKMAMPLILEKIPLFLLAAGVSVITYIVQKDGGAIGGFNFWFYNMANALVSYVEYLEKMIWPRGLSILYPHPGNAVSIWKSLLCGWVLAGITIWVVKAIRHAPYLALGWFWYLGTLVPVIGIVQAGSQSMADRYVYVPLIGIFIMMAWGLPELLAKWRFGDKALTVLAGVGLPILMIMTWMQVSHWKNSITIFEHAIKVIDKEYPNFSIAHNNLGHALIAEGKNKEAIVHYRMAIKLKPDSVKAHFNLGHALTAEGRNEDAIAQYKRAIKFQPDYVAAHFNLAHALFTAGKTQASILQYKRVIKLQPDLAGAHNNLGHALLADEKAEEAIFHFMKAIKLQPDYALARQNLKLALLQSEKEDSQ
jgi:protein O-mannosyl-transferase